CSETAGIIAQSHLGGRRRNVHASIKKISFTTAPAVYDITRLFDIIISLTGLIILLPFFLLIALIIKFSSRGPVIFSQKRVGKNNRDFTLYKFRTMRVDENDPGSLL